jgi:hypothetical protein
MAMNTSKLCHIPASWIWFPAASPDGQSCSILTAVALYYELIFFCGGQTLITASRQSFG